MVDETEERKQQWEEVEETPNSTILDGRGIRDTSVYQNKKDLKTDS